MSGLHGLQPAMGINGTTVAHAVVMQVAVPPEEPQPMKVVLIYDIADPYAVRAEFHIAPGARATWVFARQLMSEGLKGPTGDGDVRVSPSGVGRDRRVDITLMSQDCSADVQAAEADITRFLRESDSLCRPGEEHRHLDVGGGLRALLATDAPG